MLKNDCLEKLKNYKLEHQIWFNDIHVRLNKLLVEKKKVKFESLSKVASKWIIPANSSLKNLEGFTEVQKLILKEVQEYKKIIELTNSQLSTSFFESKLKAFQKRNEKIIFHADVLGKIYQNIVAHFNKLEQELILKKKNCSQSKLINKTTANRLKNVKTTKTAISTNKDIKNDSVKKTTNVVSTIKNVKNNTVNTNKEVKSTVVKSTSKTLETNKTLETPNTVNKETNKTASKTTEQTTNTQTVNPLSADFNKELLNSLNINRTKTAPKEEQKTALTEEFKLEDEIKRVIG